MPSEPGGTGPSVTQTVTMRLTTGTQKAHQRYIGVTRGSPEIRKVEIPQ